MPFIDIFLCNAEEGRIMSGIEDPVEAARFLLAFGPKQVIIKLGAEGCLLVRKEDAIHIPGIQISVADTTGAGDAFAAGLIKALLQGENIIDACRAGNRAGAQNAACFGALGNWLAALHS